MRNSAPSLGDILRDATNKMGNTMNITTASKPVAGPPPAIKTDAPSVVQFNMTYRGNAPISLIAIIRNVTGWGLYESKQVVDTARDTSRTALLPLIRMTVPQFGHFVAAILADNAISLADVRMTDMTIITVPAPIRVFDFATPR